MADESLIAVFVDFENLAIGVGDMKPKQNEFKIELVLKRLLEKGRSGHSQAGYGRRRGGFRGRVRHRRVDPGLARS